MVLKTLGGLTVEGAEFSRPKLLLLLAYLALEGPQEKRHLAALFWRGAKDPLASLRVALTRLRQGVPGSVDSDQVRVWTTIETDAQRLLDSLENHQLHEVVIYHGPFLEGMHISDWGPELEEWVYGMRESLASHVRHAILDLGEGDAARGAFDTGAERAERAYFLPGAPEPEPKDFRRIHRLLQAAGSALANEVYKEAEDFGVSLELDYEEARQQLERIPTAAVVIAANPYKGLASFREDDADVFFGRDAVIDELKRTVSSQVFTAVVGSSGSGKTSLVFAGLLPKLCERGNWLIAQLRPGRSPFLALASAFMTVLEPNLGPADHLLESKKLATALRCGDLALSEVVTKALQAYPASRLLLVIDQFEELFSIGTSDLAGARSDTEQDALSKPFLEQLVGAVRLAADRFRLVLTVRADFTAQMLLHRPLVDLLQGNQFLLGPMGGAEMREVIERPAQLRGVEFEAGLVDRILKDVADRRGSLPLLEFALEQLWEQQQGGRLTHRQYDAIGGVEEALARHADQTMAAFGDVEAEAAQRVFLQLVHPGEGQEDTRRVATRGEVGAANWALVSRLATARLVVTGRDESGDETAEIIHEALIRKWGALRGWVNEHRTFRVWQERLRKEVQVWLHRGRDAATLLRGYYLEEARQKLGLYGDQLSRDELEFIKVSIQQHDHEVEAREAQRQRVRELESRRIRQFRRLALVLAGLVVVAGVAAGVAVDRQRLARSQTIRADRTAQLARARELSVQGRFVFEAEPLLGVRLTIEGLVLVPDSEDRAELSLAEVAGDLSRFGRLAKLGSDIEQLFSREGLGFVVIDRRNVAGELVDLATGRQITALSGEVSRVQFSPDASVFIVIYEGIASEIRLAANPGSTIGLPGRINRVEWGSGGSSFLVDYEDAANEVRVLWDLESPLVFTRPVDVVDFSPDRSSFVVGYALAYGAYHVVGKPESTVVLYHVVDDVEFSPDGSLFVVDYATVAGDVRSVADPGVRTALPGRVRGVEFSPDGSLFIVHYTDAASEVRLAEDPGRPLDLPGAVRDIEFDAGGSLFIVHYENVGSEARLVGDPGTPLDFSGETSDVRLSSDGLLFIVDYGAVGSGVYLVANPGIPVWLTHEVSEAWLSPDGSLVFVQYVDVGTSSKRYELLDIAEPDSPIALPGDVDAVVFAPDGSLFIVDYGDAAGEVRSTADPGTPIATLPGDLASVDLSSEGSLVRFTYMDGGSELWDWSDPPSRLADLDVGLTGTIFGDASDRVVTLYADGRSYLVDVGWLRALQRASEPSSAALVDVACEGPFALGLIDTIRLESFFSESVPQACGNL